MLWQDLIVSRLHFCTSKSTLKVTLHHEKLLVRKIHPFWSVLPLISCFVFFVVFRVLVPISFFTILLTCLLCVFVTLRVAYLEMGGADVISRNGDNNNVGYPRPDSLQRSFISAPPNPPQTPNPLSNITGQALRSLSLDTAIYRDGELYKPHWCIFYFLLSLFFWFCPCKLPFRPYV